MARPSCRPAVPPPPVSGAPCGTVGLSVWVAGCVVGLAGVAGFEVVAVAGAVAASLCVVVAVCVAVEVAVAVPVPLGASAGFEVPVPVPEGVAVPDGEKIDGTLDAGVPVHAETVAETRTIKVAQLTTARCAFMNPPPMPG
jgi:hypothetical protein